MIELSPIQRRALRAAAHHLNPVVSISQNGLTESVMKEIDLCLKSHELIKVRLYGIERDTRPTLLTEICTQLACAPVQSIGNLLILWREKPEGEKEAKPAPRRTGAKPRTKKQLEAAAEKRRHR